MRTQAEVEALCRDLYRALGHDPADLIQFKPKDGTWADALSYEIARKDGQRTRVHRKHLDDGDNRAIQDALKAFS